MNIYPFDSVAKQARQKMAEGWTINQQFNCAYCGTKQTMDEANKFFTTGKCEECGLITDIQRDGCNFMASRGARP